MIIFEGQRLDKKNIEDYIKLKYPKADYIEIADEKIIKGVKPLLQKNYGGNNDCTLTAMTSIIAYETNKAIQNTYNIVEEKAKKYGFKNEGTSPILAPLIFNESYKACGVKPYLTTIKPFKGICWNINTIKKMIDNNKPVMLSMPDDGRHCYGSHSVTVIGYMDLIVDKKNITYLCIYDNWKTDVAYIDYDILPIVASIYHKI